MGDIGHKVLSHLFQIAQPGDVLHDQNDIAITKGCGGKQQGSCGIFRRTQFQWRGQCVTLDKYHETGIANQVGHGLAAILFDEAKQFFSRRIPPLQFPIGGENDNAVRQRRSNILDALGQLSTTLFGAFVALLHSVEEIGHVAPDAACFGGWSLSALVEPIIESGDVGEGPQHIQAATQEQGEQSVAP